MYALQDNIWSLIPDKELIETFSRDGTGSDSQKPLKVLVELEDGLNMIDAAKPLPMYVRGFRTVGMCLKAAWKAV